jgi:hypothetical protein
MRLLIEEQMEMTCGGQFWGLGDCTPPTSVQYNSQGVPYGIWNCNQYYYWIPFETQKEAPCWSCVTGGLAG